MPSEIRILLVCPSAVITAGLSQILGTGKGITIVDSLSDLTGVTARRISSLRVDAVVLDPAVASADVIFSLKEFCQPFKDCILIGALNAAYSKDVLQQFDSYFTINDSPANIVNSIRDAIASVSSETSEEDSSGNVLSSREKEILAEVARGLTNKEIADKLNISVFTVTTHRKNISQKIGIRSIAGLTVYAVMNGIIK